jgi:hypothetical protein
MGTIIPARVNTLLRSGAGRWFLVGVLSAFAVLLALQAVTTPAPARAQVTAAGETGPILAVAGQITGDSYGIYLFDRRRNVMTIYQWLPNVRKLRLLAARNVAFDLQLDEYNTEPSPAEIQDLVRQGRRLSSPETP